jgi:SAM-dependent methyltransferase
MQSAHARKPTDDLHVAPPGLAVEHFRQLAVRGLGNGENSYAHSMAWFKGRLFVGTMRNTMCLLKRSGRALPPPQMECWPVIAEDPMPPERMRAEIWRYTPEHGAWTRIYRSPMITRDGQEVMRDVGYRGLCVFRGKSDPSDALYVASASGTGLRILRSLDGETFEEVGKPGLGDPRLASCRSLLSLRGKLYATPVGTEGKNPNESERPVIFETDDPVKGPWREACEVGFGDPDNRAIAEMCAFNGYLYAGTLNPTAGFQLWKTRGEGAPPYAWTRVMTLGAYRGYINEGTASLCVFGDALYIGTGVAGGGYNRYHKIGPAPAELIRLYPDDTWDLAVGAPRITPQGIKLPVSGLGPGFGNALNGYFWRMGVHEGWLYVGTYNAAAWFPFIPVKIPEEYLQLLKLRDTDEFVAQYGGCHLWRTHDGEEFVPVTTDGFGTLYNFGIRQLVSTPAGLFVGTANPFGPEVGVKRNGAWAYEENPRGGMEVWLGRRSAEGEPPAISRSRTTAVSQQRGMMSKLARFFMQWIYGHLTEDFYEGSGFTQMGLWQPGVVSGKKACEDLVEELLRLVPEHQGPVLDVACGKGATTAVLARHFHPASIFGIDAVPGALDEARQRLPECTFRVMSSTRLEYPDAFFRLVMCVEQAAYFDTRREFIREALRVLEPGGHLVLSDILYTRDGDAMSPDRCTHNHLSGPAAYVRLLEREGFKRVHVIDATDRCARTYQTRITRHLLDRFRAAEIGEGDFNTLMAMISRHVLFLHRYVLVSATKF